MDFIALNVQERLSRYLSEEPLMNLREELANVRDDDELKDRLLPISFGTAGIRGKMEAGYNRMNRVTVFRFAMGLFKAQAALNERFAVVIGFDARENGAIFAHDIALVLVSLGVKVRLMNECLPTPLLAFATKFFGADYGIMVTASHNPFYDNGIKLFDIRGAQVNRAFLSLIERHMNEAPLRSDYADCFTNKMECVDDEDLIVSMLWKSYLKEIGRTAFFNHHEIDRDVSIAYTPLHGVGGKFFIDALGADNFNMISVVEHQKKPSARFESVPFPNPEEPGVLDLVEALALKKNISWIFANDPDADRLQVSCLNEEGHYQKLTGNEMGTVLGYFSILSALKRHEKPLVASSIVSSRMLNRIAHKMGAHYVDALTGFGNITDAALKRSAQENCQFVFGYEEAIGFLVGQAVLDKDGINASVRFAEIAGLLKRQNKTIWQLLDELFLQFGLFVSTQWSMRFEGPKGKTHMDAIMELFRTLGSSEQENLLLGGLEKYDLNSPIAISGNPYYGLCSNVIIFESKNALRLIIRPSGTEPKIKFYLEATELTIQEGELKKGKQELGRLLSEISSRINKLILP